MSAPNSSYDPVQPEALSEVHLASLRQAGLAAFAEAPDTGALHTAKTEHLGDRSPISKCRGELGALPPQARADAGKRVNAVRQDLQAAHDTIHDADTEIGRNERFFEFLQKSRIRCTAVLSRAVIRASADTPRGCSAASASSTPRAFCTDWIVLTAMGIDGRLYHRTNMCVTQ